MNGRLEAPKLGILLFILSEASFFLALIIAFVFFNFFPIEGPNASTSLSAGRTFLFSICLFSSSGTMVLAERKLREGELRLCGTWLIATLVLGTVFLIGQVSEYRHMIAEGATISRNVFGATFYTLTGFHGLHVLVGLVAIAILAVLVSQGRLTERHESGVGAVGWYWHYVDAVWVVIFSIVYLWGR